MRAARHDVLFEPLEIGSKVFRNRFYSVPHASFIPGRRSSEIAFRAMKAEGGWAAVCGGVISIRADSWGGLVPRIWDEVDREVLRGVAAEVHRHGALAGIELGHGGARGEGDKFSPALGVSQVAHPGLGHLVPKAMELDDIRRLQDDWVAAAGLAVDLGYDIVYAYGSHGTLPAQFLSPYFNRRTDHYGGSLQNRARFWLELIDRFRSSIGDRCVVAARIAADSLSPFGVTAEETLDFIRMADDQVDLWDVNVGFGWEDDSAPFRLREAGYQLAWTGRVREVTAKPIVGVGRLTDPDAMADILRSGVWDLIGAARPGIADPFLPRKIEEGRYDEARECTGSNFCIASETTGAGLSCVQNSTIGEEHRRGWHPERFEPARDPARAVLVVGAGPAGLECARVLGERGFEHVHVVDAADEAGGHLRWVRRLPGMAGLGRIVDYRTTQIRRLPGVELILGRPISADDVLGYGADLVVVATGARWRGPDADVDGLLAGADLPVLTPEDVMVDSQQPPGTNVVVWDVEGGAVAAGLAERLAAGGQRVTVLTPYAVVAPLLDATFEGGGLRRRLHELGVVVRTEVSLVGCDGGGLIVADGFGEESVVPADSVVAAVQRVSDERLYRDLAARGDSAGLFRIGDCVSPRAVWRCTADGHRLGREIDTDNPLIPLPTHREDDHDARRYRTG